MISIDTETDLIAYHNVVPTLICLSAYDPVQNRVGLWRPQETPIGEWLQKSMADPKEELVGQNIAFDLSVLSWYYPKLLKDIFLWLRQGRIHDTMLREQLLNLTQFGGIDIVETDEISRRISYSLASLEFKYLGIDRSAEKQDEDAPRLNYREVKDLPVKEWPENFVKYAKEDAINTWKVFDAQEDAAEQCQKTYGKDPFKTAALQTRKHFSLRLLEATGTLVDKDRVLAVQQEVMDEYDSPRLREPLLKTGILIDAQPEMAQLGRKKHTPACKANGKPEGCDCPRGKAPQAHVEGCSRSECDCPAKMKKAQPEKYSTITLHDYVFDLAAANDLFSLKANPSTRKLLKEKKMWDKVTDEEGYFRREILGGDRTIAEGGKEKISFTLDEEWKATYASLDSTLAIWAERAHLAKMANTYIPQMFVKDAEGELVEPADIIHASYAPIKKTGRTSSYASKNYPSRNDQNVDPRIRACTIPREGNILISIDYSALELCTTAQKCYDLFGHSVLRDKINAGVDTHAFLGAQIAFAMDSKFGCLCSKRDVEGIYDTFIGLKGVDTATTGEQFESVYRTTHPEHKDEVTWDHFYKHYRTMAKPFGLGRPGGLGHKTLITVAKGTYGLVISKEIAKSILDVVHTTYPEIPEYLEWIKKHAVDPYYAADVVFDEDDKPSKRVWYSYETPGGLYRPRCTFCQAANGNALQAPAAEGAAGYALPEVQEACWLAEEGDPLYGAMPLAFIHDEILGECPEDDKIGLRAREVEKIMVENMQRVTPDVTIRCESAAMRRWNKAAEGIWEGDTLKVWEEENE